MKTPNKITGANSRPAFPFREVWVFMGFECRRQSGSAAVAQFGRSATPGMTFPPPRIEGGGRLSRARMDDLGTVRSRLGARAICPSPNKALHQNPAGPPQFGRWFLRSHFRVS
jgi:hypothetical protein